MPSLAPFLTLPLDSKIWPVNSFNIEDNRTLAKFGGMGEQFRTLKLQLETIADDIDDFMDEKPIELSTTTVIDDLDINTNRIEQLRTSYRRVFKELQFLNDDNFEQSIQKQYELKIGEIKVYIKRSNEIRKTLHEQENVKINQEKAAKQWSTNFTINEVQRSIVELRNIFDTDSTDIADDELLRRQSNLPNHLKQLEILSRRFQDMLKVIPSGSLSQIEHNCEGLLDAKDEYVKCFQQDIQFRELKKCKKFNASSLNIKLSKFKGYESSVDIYTFQNNFEKIYEGSTPIKMLPDLLKNNFLEDPSLSLVKSVDDIAEIWQRLKMAYGHPKLMLTKKLADVSKFISMWKQKDPEKLIESLKVNSSTPWKI